MDVRPTGIPFCPLMVCPRCRGIRPAGPAAADRSEDCSGCLAGNVGPAGSAYRHVSSDPEGELTSDYADALRLGYHLAVLPVARLHVDHGPVAFPEMINFYPAGWVDLATLSIRD